MTLTILILVVVAALAVAFFILTRRDQVAVAANPPTATDDIDGVVSEPTPVNGVVHASGAEGITWTHQFDPSSGTLSDESRLRLIDDLGLLRAPWCIPLLEQACREESDPAHSAAARRALALCRDQDVRDRESS
jgi:hypothetical protein